MGVMSSPAGAKLEYELEPEDNLVEKRMAIHMAKWGAVASPVLLVVSYLIWSTKGLESSAFAIVLVLINFAVTAKLMEFGGRYSLAGLMAAALASFIFDLALLSAAIIPFATASWMDLWALGLTLIATHLGLVVFEASTISTRMALMGLRHKEVRS